MLNTITTLYWDVHTLCFQRTIMYTAAFDLQAAFQEVGRSSCYYFQGCGNSWKRLGNLSQAPRLHEVAKFSLEPRSTTVSLCSSNTASFCYPKTEHNCFHPTTATKIVFIWGRE